MNKEAQEHGNDEPQSSTCYNFRNNGLGKNGKNKIKTIISTRRNTCLSELEGSFIVTSK